MRNILYSAMSLSDCLGDIEIMSVLYYGGSISHHGRRAKSKRQHSVRQFCYSGYRSHPPPIYGISSDLENIIHIYNINCYIIRTTSILYDFDTIYASLRIF